MEAFVDCLVGDCNQHHRRYVLVVVAVMNDVYNHYRYVSFVMMVYVVENHYQNHVYFDYDDHCYRRNRYYYYDNSFSVDSR